MAIATLMVVLLAGCGRSTTPPVPGTASYEQAATAFTVGVAALEAGADAAPDVSSLAERELSLVTRVAPMEPAGWADLGLLYTRQGQYPRAADCLRRAAALAPHDARVMVLQAVLATAQGDAPGAVAAYRRAAAASPQDLRVRFELAQALEAAGSGGTTSEARSLVASLCAERPENLAARLELLSLDAALGDRAATTADIDRVAPSAQLLPVGDRSLVSAARSAVASRSPLAGIAAELRNAFQPVPVYRAGYAEFAVSNGQPGTPIETFIVLPQARATPEPPDTGLRYSVQTAATPGLSDVWAAPLSDRTATTLIAAVGGSVRIAGASVPHLSAISGPASVLAVDLQHDYLADLVTCSPAGVRILRQVAAGRFTDVTASARLPASIAGGSWYGAWPLDLESDGDLDLVLGANDGPTECLRNNGNGTFTELPLFRAVRAARSMLWVQLQPRGDQDAVFLDATGAIQVFDNERGGNYVRSVQPVTGGRTAAIAAGDLTGTGVFDIVALEQDGRLLRIARSAPDAWTVTEIGRWSGAHTLAPGRATLFVADLDNNGAMDVAASDGRTTHVWLNSGGCRLTPATDVAIGTRAVIDMNGDGVLDLVGIAGGTAATALGAAPAHYGYQEYRLRASERGGNVNDERVNTFGIGSRLEVRSGLAYECALAQGPFVHIGLGRHPHADVARVTWPNSVAKAQVEFPDPKHAGLAANVTVATDQRLQASCPFLFTWDGSRMRFITDCIWRSPLGLRINAVDTDRVDTTRDWVKVPGEALQARGGRYDLSITAELRETHIFDALGLKVVDHPSGTEIWCDERFSVPFPPLRVYVTREPQPLAGAVASDGTDETAALAAIDGSYAMGFRLGKFQGVAEDHWLELTLPEPARAAGKLYLICSGWVHPTDGSINVAIGQGAARPPYGIDLQVEDAAGRWHTAQKALGFPEGKVKNIVLDISHLFPRGAPLKLRMRTNLEVYWDRIAWAAGASMDGVHVRDLTPVAANLRWRGFSEVFARDAQCPELPRDYEHTTGAGQPYRDLEGCYTRYGDVTPLVLARDDHYVIMDAGDELRFQFAEQPPTPSGFVRDFILTADGWIKDENYNTVFSRTLIPLPLHRIETYTAEPHGLIHDPAYLANRADWTVWHTRWVDASGFNRGLAPALQR